MNSSVNGKTETVWFDHGGRANLSASASSTPVPEALSLAPTEYGVVSYVIPRSTAILIGFVYCITRAAIAGLCQREGHHTLVRNNIRPFNGVWLAQIYRFQQGGTKTSI